MKDAKLIWLIACFGCWLQVGHLVSAQGLANTRLQFIQGSSDDSLQGSTIKIRGGSGPWFTIPNVNYLYKTNFLSVPQGAITISITPLGGTTAVFSHTFLPGSDTIIAVMHGFYDTLAYPNLGSLRIDTAHGRIISRSGNQNDVSVFHGSADAPQLTFKARLGNPIPLASNLHFGNFAQFYSLVDTTDSLVKVYDPTLMEVVETYRLPDQFFGSSGQAALVFASGFVYPDLGRQDPDFGLYYADSAAGTAVPLVRVSRNAPIWGQYATSLRVWFEPLDTFGCQHGYYWEFLDSSNNVVDTSHHCNPSYVYSDTGTYQVRLRIDNTAIVDTFPVTVRCPRVDIQYELVWDSLGGLLIINHTTPDSSVLPVTYTWTVNGVTQSGDTARFDSLDDCGYTNLAVCVDPSCGDSYCETVLLRKGYLPDKPLRSSRPYFPIKLTPSAWSRGTSDPFLNDHQQMHIDQSIYDFFSSCSTCTSVDVLVYYDVPEACGNFGAVEMLIVDWCNQRGIAYSFFERITVASLKQVSLAQAESLLTLIGTGGCTPIRYIDLDMPMPAYPYPENISGYPAIEDWVQIGSGIGQGNGVGICTIGSGVEVRIFKENSAPPDCWEARLVDFTEPSCTTGKNSIPNEQDKGTHIADILNAFCPSATQYYYNVVFPDPNSEPPGKPSFKPSDVMEAIECAIRNKSTKDPISILTFNILTSDLNDSKDAIAALANIAAMNGILVVASNGSIVGGLPSPAAAPLVFTVGSVKLTAGSTYFAISPQGSSMTPHPPPPWPPPKPDVSAVINAMYDNKVSFATYGLPPSIVAAEAALLCEIGPQLQRGTLEELLVLSSNQPSGNRLPGAGIVNLDSAVQRLTRDTCHLGFHDYYGKNPCVSHESDDIEVTVVSCPDGGHTIGLGCSLRIKVTVYNDGAFPYDASKQHGTCDLYLHEFSPLPSQVSTMDYLKLPLPDIDAHGQAEITFDYTVKDEVKEMLCVEAVLNAICDCQVYDNYTKRNEYRYCPSPQSQEKILSMKLHNIAPTCSVYRVVSYPPGFTGFDVGTDFVNGVFGPQDLPKWIHDTLRATAPPYIGGVVCITYYAVINSVTVMLGGVSYEFCDSIMNSTPNPLPADQVSLHPVPATQSVTVQVTPGSSGAGAIEMYTLLGQMIERREVWWQRDVTKEDVFLLDDLPPGVYLFKISLGDRVTFKKFVKI